METRKKGTECQKNTFTPEHIVGKLRQIEVLVRQGKTVPQACKGAGIVEQTSTSGAENMAACKWSKLKHS